MDSVNDSVTVLSVDADPETADVVASPLEGEDGRLEVTTVTSAAEALAHLDGHAVDCVVSQAAGLDTDGLAVLAAVRERDSALPVVLVGGDSNETFHREAIASDATAYVEKAPAADYYERLADAIGDLVERRRTGDDSRPLDSEPADAVAKAIDVFWVYSPVWKEVRFVNGAFEELWGQPVERLRDHPRQFLQAVHPDDRQRVERGMDRLSDGQSIDQEFRIESDGDGDRWLWTRGQPICDDDETVTEIVGTTREITERKERERSLRRSQRRFETVFESPHSFFSVIAPDGTLRRTNETALSFIDADRESVEGEPFWETPWWTTHSDHSEAEVRNWFERAAAGEYVQFEARHTTADGDETIVDGMFRPMTDEDGEVVSIIADARDITQREKRKRAVRVLQEVTREFMQAATRERVAEIAVAAIGDILDMPASTIWFVDGDEDALRPAARSEHAIELVGEAPVFRPGESLAWDAFESGEVRHYADVSTAPGRLNPETTLGSELILPLGDHGVIVIASAVVGAFTDVDRSLAKSLATNIEAAFERVEREDELREQRRALQRQNERLDEFAGLVSHDLRNPLQVACGRIEVLRTEFESEHLDVIEEAHERMQTLIDDLLVLARDGETATGVDTLDLATVVEECWQTVDTDSARLSVDADGLFRADETQSRQLLENLIRNAVEHGGPGVTVSVGELDDGFYLEDDGPGIPPDQRAAVFETGYSTAENGTGLGLTIVKQIADAHGWDLAIVEGSDCGVRFEITGVERP